MIPPPATPPKPVRRRSSWARLSANPDVRSVQIAVVATILVHLLLLWLAPEAAPPPKPEPLKFVEANPNAPDNVPDKTDNFAAQNQQAAQEKPSPDHSSNAPALKGDKSPDTTAIVTGDLARLAPSSPPAPKPSARPETPEEAAARRARIPLPGFERVEGDNTDGLGSNVAKFAPGPKTAPEAVEGDPNAKSDTGPSHSLYYTVDPRHPQPRRSLPATIVKARPSPLRNSDVGTENIGAVAYDAKWSSYGEYLQKFIDTVQVQWERILYQSNIYPTEGTKVTVVFRMDSTGKISEITKVDGSGGRAAQDACVSAITARDPYGPWTDDMIAVLGKSQELTFTFTYE